jgi:hypothetical protein
MAALVGGKRQGHVWATAADGRQLYCCRGKRPQ